MAFGSPIHFSLAAPSFCLRCIQYAKFALQTPKNEMRKFVVVVDARSSFSFTLGANLSLPRVSRTTAVNLTFFLLLFFGELVSLMEKVLNRFRFEFDVNANKR